MKTLFIIPEQTADILKISGYRHIVANQDSFEAIAEEIITSSPLPFVVIDSEFVENWQNMTEKYESPIIWTEFPSLNGRKSGEILRRNIRNLTGIA